VKERLVEEEERLKGVVEGRKRGSGNFKWLDWPVVGGVGELGG